MKPGILPSKQKVIFLLALTNGIFHLILNSEPDEAIIIENAENRSELDIFAETAAEIFSGKILTEIGIPNKRYSGKGSSKSDY